MNTRVTDILTNYSARGIPSYTLEMWHDGLKKHRSLRDSSKDVIRRKAELQAQEWDQKWWEAQKKQAVLSAKLSGKRRQDEQKALAIERTSECEAELQRLSQLLRATLTASQVVDWEVLKDTAPFGDPSPKLAALPQAPVTPPLPEEPQKSDWHYQPKLGLLDHLVPSRRQKRIAEKDALFKRDHEDWQREVSAAKQAHARELHEHAEQGAALRSGHSLQVQAWQIREEAHNAAQRAHNAEVDQKRQAYVSGDQSAVLEFCDLVLSHSAYPDYFPHEFDLDYETSPKLLIADYRLPSPDDLPHVKAVKYVATRDEFEESHLSESARAKLYDDVLYQVTLRTLHELFRADTANTLDAVVFNGIVTSVDRSTGKDVTACVLSVRAPRDEFAAINLTHVDPKACFKALRGVGSSKLHGLAPIAPIMPLRRDDARFVAAYAVADALNEGVNLASMGWEDFEHLIRELFEKEFSASGGEVKVTQASRDGGVDAVAFDPDPIRGGKIVIQAKRYTNTVGVSAVRDLYGTVLNEGATKGILVTTSDYGPDSYSFAAGKPLVLLSGSNLLHMLQKHGHQAHINIREAKKLLAG
jgi:restriction system protein